MKSQRSDEENQSNQISHANHSERNSSKNRATTSSGLNYNEIPIYI